MGRDQFQRGTILFYQKEKTWGKVVDLQGNKWSFKDNALVDPWLEEYCHTTFSSVSRMCSSVWRR